MKILHYSLGFPPYRTGGMTKFCMDLMQQQNKDGHQVALLWPGQMKFIEKAVHVKDRGIVYLNGRLSGIRSFEIINPLPISYDEGIAEFQAFIKNDGIEIYQRLLDNYRPNIIHIHTLMGLHKDFLIAAKKKGIRMIFTTHDFFPVCPKVTIFRRGTVCLTFKSCNECGVCNATALGIEKIKLLQSPIYRILKDSAIIKKLRKKHRDNYLSEYIFDDSVEPVGTAKDFQNLRSYYGSMLSLMDMIHFNSRVTEAVYKEVFHMPENVVINITHADVMDHKRRKNYTLNRLKIRYLGSYGGAKGFFLLKAALDKLWNRQQNFCLDLHFTPPEISAYMNIHGRYNYSELKEIFKETDILIVPSIWYETFGFTALEALSFGVPVILSDTVGAKDILVDGAGIVIENITADKLCDVIGGLTTDKLIEMNRIIIEKQKIMLLQDMAEQLEEKCYRR